jgi:superfamily II DNA/RNA helicase
MFIFLKSQNCLSIELVCQLLKFTRYLLVILGRVARAGKQGSAFSLVSYEELAYLIDLYLFLGKDLKFTTAEDEYPGNLKLFKNS